MHRIFLELIKRDLDSMRIRDINNVQALLIYNIGNQQVSIGELATRGMYNGSNVSYNLKKLTEFGYVKQKPSPHDKRSFFVELTDKGKLVFKKIDASIERQTKSLNSFLKDEKELDKVFKGMQSIESFWNQNGVWF